MNPQTLKEYVVVMRHDAVPSIWTRSQWRDYLKNCEEIDHPNTKETGYYIAATFNTSDELKDSPYQGSAGVWRSAAKPPGITQWYVVKCEQRRFASLIYVDSKITLERVAKDIDVEIDLLEWLDESAAAPAGDGWNATAEQLPPKNELVLVVRENGYMLCKDWEPHTNQDEAWFREHFTHWRPLPTPPNKSV